MWDRALLAAALAIALGFMAWSLPPSLRAHRAEQVLPRDSACADRPYSWARSEGATPQVAEAEDTPALRPGADSVFVTRYGFRPGRPGQIVSSGLLENRSASTIEIRGYRVDFLSPTGNLVGESACRVIMGGEQCGVGGINLKRPGAIALIADTLPDAPVGADLDTARIYWSYCRALSPRE